MTFKSALIMLKNTGVMIVHLDKCSFHCIVCRLWVSLTIVNSMDMSLRLSGRRKLHLIEKNINPMIALENDNNSTRVFNKCCAINHENNMYTVDYTN